MNSKKTTSPRLKRIFIYECITFSIMLCCLMFFLFNINNNKASVYIIFLCATSLCFITGFVLTYFYYKELKRIALPIEYYTRKIPFCFWDSFSIGLCFCLGILIFGIFDEINMSFSIMVTIHISIFSLIFVLYLFILPILKKSLTENYNDLQKLFEQAKKNKSLNKIDFFQGEIFSNNRNFNHLSTSMVIATILFTTTLILFMIFRYRIISYFILFTSIFFDLIFICRLAILIKKNYSNDLKKLQILIEKQNKELNNLTNQTHIKL